MRATGLLDVQGRRRSDVHVVFLQSSRACHHPRHHFRMAASLARAGYRVRTMAQPDLGGDHIDAVPIACLPERRSRVTRMLTGPLTMTRALREDPDVLHVVCLDLLPWAVLARVLRPRVVVLYDSNEEYDLFIRIKDWLPRPLRPMLAGLVRRWEPRLAARLHGVTVAVPATQERFCADAPRALLVRNFVPQSLVATGAREEDFRYDVLFGGSLLEPQIPLLAETAARLRSLLGRPVRWLTAVRHLDPRSEQLLDTALREHGIRGEFSVLANRPFDEMRRLADASAVAFAPYPADARNRIALPMRLFEYMAWGVPFVTSELPALTALLGDHRVGVFTPAGDAEGYASALARLLGSPDLGRAYGSNGRHLSRTLLNWEDEAARLVELYDELLGIGGEQLLAEEAA
jgi:glycosyltransferase involved in cell wall biosynthesis